MTSEYMESLTDLMLEKVKAERISFGLKTLGWVLFFTVFSSLYSSAFYKAGGFLLLSFLCFITSYLCDLWSQRIACQIRTLRFYDKSS